MLDEVKYFFEENPKDIIVLEKMRCGYNALKMKKGKIDRYHYYCDLAIGPKALSFYDELTEKELERIVFDFKEVIEKQLY